jgi:A/G-specific adenine glycosylase
MGNRLFSSKVIGWYDEHKRSLPWRSTKDPYKIWLSEIILQQTRVIQGLPYYKNFIKTFPTVQALAAAETQEVLRLWQGLGYYTRARNLHACAKTVVNSYHGKFPTTFETLQTLPGIGAYTAAAIASFCFKEPVAVVDGNVYRVLSRFFGIDTPINSPKGIKEFRDLANSLIDTDKPDEFNQAIMEFGAIQCTPKNPNCEECVLQSNCFAFAKNAQTLLPVKNKAKKPKNRFFNYFIITDRKGQILMKERGPKDIWQGLHDFYMIETEQKKRTSQLLIEDPFLAKLVESADVSQTKKSYKHVLSHQIIHATFTVVKVGSIQPIDDYKFYPVKKIDSLPKPVLITRFLTDAQLF